MKLILACTLLLLLAGCYQNVEITEIMKGRQYCADKGGLLKIRESMGGVSHIFCISGNRIHAKKVALEIKGITK